MNEEYTTKFLNKPSVIRITLNAAIRGSFEWVMTKQAAAGEAEPTDPTCVFSSSPPQRLPTKGVDTLTSHGYLSLHYKKQTSEKMTHVYYYVERFAAALVGQAMQ